MVTSHGNSFHHLDDPMKHRYRFPPCNVARPSTALDSNLLLLVLTIKLAPKEQVSKEDHQEARELYDFLCF